MNFAIVLVLLLASLVAALAVNAADIPFMKCAAKCEARRQLRAEKDGDDAVLADLRARRGARCLSRCRPSRTELPEPRLPAPAPVTDALADSSADAERDAPVNPAVMFNAVRGEMIRWLRKGAGRTSSSFDGLQMLSTPISAEWNADGGAQLQAILNAKPRWTTAFDPEYGVKPFGERYYNFLLDLKRSQDTAAMQAFEREMEGLNDQLMAASDKMFMEQAQCEGIYPAYARFYPNFDMFAGYFCAGFISAQRAVTNLQGIIKLKERQAFGDTKEFAAFQAIDKYRTGTLNGAQFSDFGGLSRFVQRNAAGQHAQVAFAATAASASESSKFEAKSSGFALVFVSYQSMKQKVELKTSSRLFSVEFGAQSWASVPVAPVGGWYDASVVRDWRAGPFRSQSQSAWFGPNGQINMLPRTLYLAYKPRVAMRVNKEDASKIEKMSSTSFGLSLSFISFNFAKGSKTSKEEQSDGSYKIIIQSNDEQPVIMAVDFSVA